MVKWDENHNYAFIVKVGDQLSEEIVPDFEYARVSVHHWAPDYGIQKANVSVAAYISESLAGNAEKLETALNS